MVELRQITIDDYEKQKQAYGFNDDQMKNILGVEPMKKWADGNSSDKQEEVSEIIETTTEIKEETPAFETPATPSFEMPAEEMSFETPAFEAPETPSFEMPTDEMSFETPAFEAPETPSFEMPAEEISFETPAFETPETPSFEMPVEEMSFETPAFEAPETPTSDTIVLEEENNDELQIAPSQINFENAIENEYLQEEELEISPTSEFKMEEIAQSNENVISLDEMFNNASATLIKLMNEEKNIILEHSDFMVKQ